MLRLEYFQKLQKGSRLSRLSRLSTPFRAFQALASSLSLPLTGHGGNLKQDLLLFSGHANC
jgi:hypothetical protein